MHVRYVTVPTTDKKVIQLVFAEPDKGDGASTASMHHFCEQLHDLDGCATAQNPALLRAFAATLPRGTQELDVLRTFFYSPGESDCMKLSTQKYEEAVAILAAAFATCDCIVPLDPSSPCYSPVDSAPRATVVEGREMSVYVASIDRGAVDALRAALDATDYEVEVEFTRGSRLRVTLRRMGCADADIRSTLSRFGAGRIYYDGDAMHRLVPLLVLAAQHDTRTWRRFVSAVHAAAGVNSELRYGVDEPVMKMLIALALSQTASTVPAAVPPSVSYQGEVRMELRHRTFIIAADARSPPGSPYSPVSRVDDEADESRLALAAYKLNTHFERVMRHRPVAAHIQVTRARLGRKGRLRVNIPKYVPPYATTDPGHYYGPYTVHIDPCDLVVPCTGLFEL